MVKNGKFRRFINWLRRKPKQRFPEYRLYYSEDGKMCHATSVDGIHWENRNLTPTK